MITFTGIAIVLFLLCLYFHRMYTKLSRRSVNHLPVVPFFGNLFWVQFKKQHLVDCLMKIINSFPEDRIVGHYDMVNPVFIIRDLETVKRITIKDYEYFIDRREVTSKYDPIISRGILMLKGDEWKAMRSTMSPAFTSSKLRLMFPYMLEAGDKLIKSLKKKIAESGKGHVDLEVKDMTIRYANDLVASCVFGLDLDTQNEDSEFFKLVMKITGASLSQIFKVFLYRAMPWLAKGLKLSLIPQETADDFKNLILSAMKYREENNIIRNDVIHMLMEVRKGQMAQEKVNGFNGADAAAKKKHNYVWSDDDLVSQAVIFLFAGFETVSTAMMFIIHELATNPEVQDRLAQEIKEQHLKNNGMFDFKTVEDLVYMDMVVTECLRLWPPFATMDRCCVKDYNIGKPNNKATEDLIIRKGEIVIYPAWAFHRDPQYFPNPNKFDPERFSPQNREKIVPSSYMPFGMGPRSCIGSRLALCKIKLMLYQLLPVMEIVPCEKTRIPIKLPEAGFIMRIRGGSWVRFQERTK